MSDTRFLHVANGTSTTGTIAAAGLPGARSIWADPLYEGPAPAGLNDDELCEVRMRYLAGPDGRAEAASAEDSPARDATNDLREWRAVIARHEAYDELVLWFEHDLFDQLNLIQLLTWFREHVPDTKRVSLICIGSFPGRPDFKGFGELTPAELASLFETRRPIADQQFDLARRAWQAFREAAPNALDELRRGDTSALPFLAAALTRFLQEYPWTTDGLSRTERRLLELTAGGTTLMTVFPMMHEGERAYYVTDRSLAALADTLSRTSPPLLTLDRSDASLRSTLQGAVALTETGGAALSAGVDRVTACGIDRWLGGVHLQSGGRIWRWDEPRGRVV